MLRGTPWHKQSWTLYEFCTYEFCTWDTPIATFFFLNLACANSSTAELRILWIAISDGLPCCVQIGQKRPEVYQDPQFGRLMVECWQQNILHDYVLKDQSNMLIEALESSGRGKVQDCNSLTSMCSSDSSPMLLSMSNAYNRMFTPSKSGIRILMCCESSVMTCRLIEPCLRHGYALL